MKTPLKSIGILAGVGFTVIAGAAAAQPATFMIVNYGSGLCLEPNYSGLGAPILQQPCDSTRMTQRWVASPATATQYQIANKGYPTCLDVAGGSLQPGAQVQIYRCTTSNTNTAQIWETRAIQGNQVSADTPPKGR